MLESLEVLYTGVRYQVAALTSRSACPLLEFLDDLARSAPGREKKARYWIARVAECGPPANVQKWHQVHQERNLYVLKPDQQVRLVYFLDEDAEPKRLVITHGFFKTKRDIPPNEKTRAINAQARYWEEKGDRR